MDEAILDANILLRYLTDEPRALADRVATILNHAEEEQIALVVAPLTLAEVIYVLESVYTWPRADIADGLLNLIAASVVTFLEELAIVQSLTWYRDHPRLDFADAYVAALAVQRGHGTVITFDRDLKRLSNISVIQDVTDLEDN